MTNVFLKRRYSSSLKPEKVTFLGTFFDDRAAKMWAISEKENNPIFKRYIDDDSFHPNTKLEFDLVLKKVSLLDNKDFHVKNYHLYL